VTPPEPNQQLPSDDLSPRAIRWLIVLGCVVAGGVIGAAVGSGHEDPNSIAPGVTPAVYAIVGTGIGLGAALFALIIWSLRGLFKGR
jgi:formate hydrogenlyase subunit 3/multisubunit Na+/H+ antiporter MnhD subunit